MKKLKSVLRTNQTGGFSLIEILIITLIVLAFTLVVANLYRNVARRNTVQGEAINIASRIEQIRTLAEAQKVNYGVEYRLRFVSGSPSTIVGEYYDATTAMWVAAPEFSRTAIPLNSRVSFGVTSGITVSPTDQPTGSPVLAGEIRFNSRGFPVNTNVTMPPTAPKEANAIYINDNTTNFAVTVNILGRIQIWAYDRGASNVWIPISGQGR